MARKHSPNKDSRWSLQGMRVLVTGGTKGMGYAIVEELAGTRATIHTCSRNQSQINKCLREWKLKGFQVTGSVSDVSSQAEREKLIKGVSFVFNGKLNILINNFGINISKPTMECTAEDLSCLMSTNFESAYKMCRLAHPLLKASEAGTIIFISSVVGVIAINTLSINSVAKGVMNQLTSNLACDWAKDNIRTNCVAPWFFRTPLMEPVAFSSLVGALT